MTHVCRLGTYAKQYKPTAAGSSTSMQVVDRFTNKADDTPNICCATSMRKFVLAVKAKLRNRILTGYQTNTI